MATKGLPDFRTSGLQMNKTGISLLCVLFLSGCVDVIVDLGNLVVQSSGGKDTVLIIDGTTEYTLGSTESVINVDTYVQAGNNAIVEIRWVDELSTGSMFFSQDNIVRTSITVLSPGTYVAKISIKYTTVSGHTSVRIFFIQLTRLAAA